MMKKFELAPIDGRKSFYGKCSVEEWNAGKVAVLTSYKTKVAAIVNGEFIRIKDYSFEYSQTTLRHINAFRDCYGIPTLSKAEFLSIPARYYNPFTDIMKTC